MHLCITSIIILTDDYYSLCLNDKETFFFLERPTDIENFNSRIEKKSPYPNRTEGVCVKEYFFKLAFLIITSYNVKNVKRK